MFSRIFHPAGFWQVKFLCVRDSPQKAVSHFIDLFLTLHTAPAHAVLRFIVPCCIMVHVRLLQRKRYGGCQLKYAVRFQEKVFFDFICMEIYQDKDTAPDWAAEFLCHQFICLRAQFPMHALQGVSVPEFPDLKNFRRVIPAPVRIVFVSVYRKIPGASANFNVHLVKSGKHVYKSISLAGDFTGK